MSRYNVDAPATVTECHHEVELFERAHPTLQLTITDWNRTLSSQQLHENLAKEARLLIDNDKITSVTCTQCRSGMIGVDYVMKKCAWEHPKCDLVDEDEIFGEDGELLEHEAEDE